MSATHALHTISSKINLAEKGAPNGVPVLNESGTIPASQSNATSVNTANAVVARDGSGNFSAGTIAAATTIEELNAIDVTSGPN